MDLVRASRPVLRLGVLLLVAAVLAPAPSRAGAAAVSPGELADEQLLLIREALRVVDEVGDDVWNGWSRAAKATLVIQGDREFLVNLPRRVAPPSDFSSTGQRFGDSMIYSRPGSLPVTLRTAFPIEGLPCAIVGAWRPDVESPDEWVVTLVEQWFHVLQLERGEDVKVRELALADATRPSWQVAYPFPFDDPDVGNAMLLLGQALYDFWSQAAQLPREGQRRFLAQTAWAALQNLRAVVILKHGDAAYRFFQLEAWRDGVARYSGLLVAREMARAELLHEYKVSNDVAGLPEHKSYARLWEENFQSRFWLIRTSGLDGERDATSFDAIGHGLAEMLDAVNPGWKDRYFEPGVWLDDLLAEGLGASRLSESR